MKLSSIFHVREQYTTRTDLDVWDTHKDSICLWANNYNGPGEWCAIYHPIDDSVRILIAGDDEAAVLFKLTFAHIAITDR